MNMENRYKLDYEVLGQRLKQARKLSGLTQHALAELVHITTNQIAKLETNKTTASIDTIINIANALSIDLNYLLLSDNESEHNNDYMDILISNQIKDFTLKEKEALLLVINAMKSCRQPEQNLH
jgi:transcriptional regulator with XRE-family HTH domain